MWLTAAPHPRPVLRVIPQRWRKKRDIHIYIICLRYLTWRIHDSGQYRIHTARWPVGHQKQTPFSCYQNYQQLVVQLVETDHKHTFYLMSIELKSNDNRRRWRQNMTIKQSKKVSPNNYFLKNNNKNNGNNIHGYIWKWRFRGSKIRWSTLLPCCSITSNIRRCSRSNCVSIQSSELKANFWNENMLLAAFPLTGLERIN